MYKVQYVRYGSNTFSEKSFEQFASAREFYNQRREHCSVTIFTETKVIDISIDTDVNNEVLTSNL
jgi:hypothetical protein